MRLFVAIDLAPELKAVVDELMAELRRARVRSTPGWVRSENLHFTMQFLGEVEESRLAAIEAAVAGVAAGQPPFDVELAGWGVFPNRQRPRVLWLGCAEPVAPMVRLADAVARALEPLGFPRETRPFHPHLTLARMREGQLEEALVRRLEMRASGSLGRMRAEALQLYESRLHPDGARYVRRGSYRLGTSAQPNAA